MIYIGNLNKTKYNLDKSKVHVYVGGFMPRFGQSIFKNPYSVKEYGREKAIDLYRKHFTKNYKTSKWQREFERIGSLANKGDIVLTCWCAPERCHAEIIKDYLDIKAAGW